MNVEEPKTAVRCHRGRPKGVKNSRPRVISDEVKQAYKVARALPEYKQWMSALQLKHSQEECDRLRQLWVEKRMMLPDWKYLGVDAKVLFLKTSAEKREILWLLTHEQARELVMCQCHYCGEASVYPRINGIDRVDNARGYEPENSVPCCGQCNLAKGIYTQKAFLEWAIRVATFQQSLK